MNNYDINLAVKCIKTLLDSCRCVNCDELNETRMRYVCGHSICEKCVSINATCMLCSPTSNAPPVSDKPQSESVRHALELLNNFQDLFNVDVFRQHRISEQLKIEKELFPQCIQAPIKYFNKRKSSILVEKENIRPSLLPGENVSSTEKSKMEKSRNYVQQWLNQNEKTNAKSSPRKPFSDLNVNSPNNINSMKIKKKPSIKNAYSNAITLRSKKIKKDDSINIKITKQENHESSIVADHDTLTIIDDSQDDIVDKDKLALMSVIQDENSLDIKVKIDKEKPKCCLQSTSNHKVPFYKKSPLVDNCYLCVKDLRDKATISKNCNTKNVTITIENKSFLTTIKLSEIKPNFNENVLKKSKAIQTSDIKSRLDMNEKGDVVSDILHEAINNTKSEDIFKNDVPIQDEQSSNGYANKSKCVIIEDSDADSSDADCEMKEVEVEAEVHRSSEFMDYVLRPLESQDYTNRTRPLRGKTPASSDSSDKENFDPNKKKRSKYCKRFKNKKTKK